MAKAREAGGAPEVKTDTVVADGAAVTAVGTSDATVAVAEAEAAGGAPAVGQGQVAEVVEGQAVRVTKLLDGGDALRRPADATDLDRGGVVEGIGYHPAETVATFGRPDAGDFSFSREMGRGPRDVAAVRRSGRDAILPLSAPTIDPETVPGTRRAVVAAPQLRRNGRTYMAGEPITIDFRAHTELVPIGGIEATPWHDLPDHDPD